ncbi:MraY family glycosyltransferase [Paramaledivibacter caminithermalis]|nr:hypothetical protein [Paramaledivibacter caminithermalis]
MGDMIYLTVFFSYFFNKLIIPLVEELYTNSGFLKKNYKGALIPNSMGIIFIFNMLFVSLFILIFIIRINYTEIYIFLLGTLVMGITGLLDDFIGNNDIKGFKGHISMLLKLKLTTGGIKAIFGGVVAILISLTISSNFLNFLTNILVISLFTNFINLVDLRPGRALKVFFVFSMPLLFFVNGIYRIILLSFIGAASAYFSHDIKGRSMLGDVGSNCLGIILGIIATSLEFNIKTLLIIFLILANLYSEIYSFTKLINKNKILNFFDELGRG